jgi:hypothetical protein
MKIKGACHCGNMSFELDWPEAAVPIAVRACSCSFCTQHGGVYASHPESRLDALLADPSQVSKYRFATRTADFYLCLRCGALPFITSLIDDHLYAVVNVNTFIEFDRSQLETSRTDFAGETVESRLQRRSQSWISRVEIVEGAEG